MKKLFYFLMFLSFLLVVSACNRTTIEDPVFLSNPTAIAGETAGDIVINAEVDGDEGVIYYIVVDKNQTAPSAIQILAGVNYGGVTVVSNGDSGATQKITNKTINLTAGTEYTVYFVIKNDELFSEIKLVNVTAKAETLVPPTLGFTSIALSAGDEDGELKVNIVKSGTIGIIYFILVAEGSTAPTKEQIVAGEDYDDVEVIVFANAAAFTNYVIEDLTPGTRYTMHTVVAHEGVYSILRNMTAAAKETIITVDKGSGTEEDPFQISTIQDLEQIGQGYYIIDEQEWNMDSFYILMNDIDLSTKYSEDLELSWPVLGADAAGARFAGVLDGDGFKILNLYIGQDSIAGAYRGFFASAEHTALIENLIFENAYVQGAGIDESNSNHGTGTIYGYFKGTIRNVQIINSTVIDTGTRLGGLAGRSYESGHVYDTYVEATVRGLGRAGGFVGVVDVADGTAQPIIYENVVFKGEVIAEDQYAGGIVGYLRGVNMSNVFVTGYIQGQREVGGIAGMFQKRAGNNNVSAFIENTVVYATVFGTSSSYTTVGNILGQQSTSNITPENEDLLKVENNYYIEGTETFGGGDSKAVLGTLITKANIKDTTWLETNLEDWDLTTSWEIKTGADRPTLKNTADDGMLGELETPLVLLPTITSGPGEKEISVKISANIADTTIYYVVLASNTTAPTAVEIKTPTGVLFSGNGMSIDQIHVMSAFDTTYYVYYYAEHADGNSEVFEQSVKSKEMTPLVVTGGLRPGEASKEVIVTLSSNLVATIYYIIVDAEGTYTKEQIKNPTGVLFSGNGATIDASHIMALEETTYYIYAYAEMVDRDSEVFESSGLSSSDTYVNYGTGTVADPFIIRTVDDLEMIGKGTYTNEALVELIYSNNAHYILAQDIDLTEKYGEGKLNWTPLPDFFGVFDGDNFTITGLYINDPDKDGHNAFISYLRDNAIVKNVTFEDVFINVQGSLTDGNNGLTGVVAGRMNNSSVENIRIINASVTAKGFRVGAIAGGTEGTNSHFNNIYVEADITGYARIGGIVGNISNSSNNVFTLNNIVFIGNVRSTGTSDFRVGGIVGWARGAAISNVYVEGSVSGLTGIAGGIVGYLENYNSSTMFSAINNVLINAVIISENSNRAGTLIGSVSGTPDKVPALADNYQTQSTTLITTGSLRTDVRNATVVENSVINQTWFETNMQGFSLANGWKWIVDAERPALDLTPDSGLIGELEIPLIITENIQSGDDEGEISISIVTNKAAATIYYAVALEGVFTANDIMTATVGETFLFVGDGLLINEVKVMPTMNQAYNVYYIVVDGTETSEVFVKTVTSLAEIALTGTFTAVTGETNPGDITLNFSELSHPSTVYYLTLIDTEVAPLAATIKSTGAVLTGETTINLTPGEGYIVYFYAEKTTGTSHTDVIEVEVTAKASPEAAFELITATLEASENVDELILTLQASHDATIQYIVLLADALAPTAAEIEADGILLTESPVTLTGLIADTEYKIYVLVIRISNEEQIFEELTQTTKRVLFNGENTSSYFPIYALEDLEAFRDGHNNSTYSNSATIEFMADIDFSETYGETGKNWFPIGTNSRKYKGQVEGNDHVINGLYINLSVTAIDMNEGTGLFGTTDNGFGIQNLHFTNVDITGNISVGVVAGYTKVTLLSNVTVDGGTVRSVNDADSRVGGIFGRFNANSATDSVFEKAWVNVDVYGGKHVGGMIGHVDYSTNVVSGEIIIRDVYAMGTVNRSGEVSSPNIGGIVGYNRGSIIRAIAYNTINDSASATQVASIAGYLQRRHVDSPEAKIIDSIGNTNISKIVGSTSEANGTIFIDNNLLVVESDPAVGEITLTQLLDVNNWGILIPLSETTWMVELSKVVLK